MTIIHSTIEPRKHVRVTPIGDQDVALDVGRPGRPAVSLAAIRIPVAELRAALDTDAARVARRLARQQRDAETERADKAEQERDAYRHDARAAESALSRVRAALGLPDDATTDDMEEAAEQPRALTPTDEMVVRFWNAFNNRNDGLEDMQLRDIDEVRTGLSAALTKPTRPKGAEDWEDWLIHTLDHEALTDQQIEDLANRIAQRVTEEQS